MNARRKNSRGFTLVELLVVIAIIGILVALLLPAVQSVREAARRVQCANNIKQLSLAALNFEVGLRHLPTGYHAIDDTNGNEKLVPGATWGSDLLPFLELQTMRDQYPVAMEPQENTHEGIAEVCGTLIQVMRCPSTSDPEHSNGEQWVDGIADRVPASYLACGSGVSILESGPTPWCGSFDSDGVMFINSKTKLSAITDGTSTTALFGETLNALGVFVADHSNRLQHVDHWIVWSRDLLYSRDATDFTESSEAIGSTAARINALDIEEAHINEKELAFGSRHGAHGINLSFCDGHVQFVTQTVDPQVYSDYGSRDSREPRSDNSNE